MKKLLLSLGSVAAVAAPIAAVVACGDNDSVKTFGHTYGKQETTGFVVKVTKQGTVVEPGNYYLSADEAKAGKTFKVLKAKATASKPAEYTTLTIVADITSGNSAGTNFTYDASGTAKALTNTTVNVANGSTTAFYVKDGDKTKESLATATDVSTSIKTLLNANKDEAVKYEADNKKTTPAQSTKEIVSELLKGTDLEFNTIALNSNGTEIDSITTQAAGTNKKIEAAKAEAKKFEDLKVEFANTKVHADVNNLTTFANEAALKNALGGADVTLKDYPSLKTGVTLKYKFVNSSKKLTIEVTLDGQTAEQEITATEASA